MKKDINAYKTIGGSKNFGLKSKETNHQLIY